MRVKLPALAWFGILYVLALILALTVPPSAATAHTLGVDTATYRLLIFTVMIPYGLVWAAAFYAYDTLKSYTKQIADTDEGKGFSSIVRGLQALAWGLILNTILGFLLSLITHWAPGFSAAQNIVSRYAGLLVTGAAFILIENGTYDLVRVVRARWTNFGIRAMIVITTVIGTFFLKLVSDNLSSASNPYHMSSTVLLLTVVIPYICVWAIGIVSAYDIHS